MAKNKPFIFISYILLIVIIVILTLIWQALRIERQMQEIESISEVRPEEFKEEQATPDLIPSRPEDYGMIVTSDFEGPRTEAEWSQLLHGKLSELKTQTPEQSLEKIRDKIREEPEKTQEKLEKIDKSIKECREILREEPGNEEIQAKLQRLMILKGLGEELQDF